MTDRDGDTARRAAFQASRLERDRTLEAIQHFEAGLAMAAGAAGWRVEVMADLGQLEAAMAEERRELHRPDALLAMIAAEHPRRFGSRVRNLREQYDDIMRQVSSLRAQLAHADEDPLDPTDLRRRGSWITRALRHCRARQTDLVYEAIEMDLGER